ncbi:MAG: helix-turn-helix transcriptional regulator [Actinomycetota bacterium]|nr:helix-turn-helix transcriptional regulator [Actinomycetota bacterium]
MDAATILRRARHRSGLSLRVLARRAGTSHSTLAAYEAGRVTPAVDTCERIVQAAGFSVTTRLVPTVATDAARSRELQEVLELAAQFPARHRAHIAYPRFGPA